MNGFTEFRMVVDPACRLVDLKAFLASYAVKLDRYKKTYISGPVTNLFPMKIDAPFDEGDPRVDRWSERPTEIDETWDLTLSRYVPLSDDPWLESHRWPFFVSEPLIACFILKSIDPFRDQWWQFTFTPGKMYEHRTIESESQSVNVVRSERPER